MKTLKQLFLLAIAILLIGRSSYAMGIEVFKNDKSDLSIGGRIQVAGYGEIVGDPARPNQRVYLFMKQARLNVHGQVEGVKYNTEWVGAAEDVNGSNNGLTLLDYSFDLPIYKTESTFFRIGQFKVPYGREMINDEAQFQFVDNSLGFKGFNLGRDVGMAVHSYHGKLAATGGVFTGGSRDVPLRFLPENLGIPMLVARVGYNDGLDKDIFTVAQNDLKPERTTKATYINAMYMRDTEIGHSTVLGSRSSERSLLNNLNWNPYITRGVPVAGSPATASRLNRADFWQIGWDAAARGKLGSGLGWTTEAEFDYGNVSNDYGKINLTGARAQGGLLKGKWEVALRYSVLLPDNDFSTTTGVRLTGTKPIHEAVPAITYYLRGHDIKIVADAPILINVPVFNERNVGSYVSTEQTDQSSVVASSAKGYVNRQTVPQGRLMFQLAF
jgi:hypothetical protein